MFDLNIEPEKLFSDPHMVTQYLDEISSEIEVPFSDRIPSSLDSETNSDLQNVFSDIQRKEEQLRVLICFITFLMDKCERKIQLQLEQIEKQDGELIQIKEENIILKSEIRLNQQISQDFVKRIQEMELFVQETEINAEEERRSLLKAQEQLKELDKLQANCEELTKENEKAYEEIEEFKKRIETQEAQLKARQKEQEALKEELEIASLKANQIDAMNEEYIQLETKHNKMIKDFETERIKLQTIITNLEAEKTLLQDNLESTQQELRKLKKSSVQMVRRRKTSPDECQENLNAKATALTLAQNRRSPFLENDINSEKTNFEKFAESQYDDMRTNVSAFSKENQENSTATHSATSFEGGSEKSKSIAKEESSGEKEDHSEKNDTNEKNSFENVEGKRRGIFEEFFLLSFQSALLNSPNFDDLAGIDMKGLFEEVTKRNIPFHKWYTWIVARLEHIHQEEIAPQISNWMIGQDKKE